MRVDESLSKGLARQLISCWLADLGTSTKRFRKEALRQPLKRSEFNKYIKAHEASYKKFSLAYYAGGSKRHPYIASVVVMAMKERGYEDWSEGGACRHR